MRHVRVPAVVVALFVALPSVAQAAYLTLGAGLQVNVLQFEVAPSVSAAGFDRDGFAATVVGHNLRLLDGSGILLSGLGTGVNKWRAEQEAAARAATSRSGWGSATYKILGPMLGPLTTFDFTFGSTTKYTTLKKDAAGTVTATELSDVKFEIFSFAFKTGLVGWELGDAGHLAFSLGFRYLELGKPLSKDKAFQLDVPMGLTFGRALPANLAVAVWLEADPLFDVLNLAYNARLTWNAGARLSLAVLDWLLLTAETEYGHWGALDRDYQGVPVWQSKIGLMGVLAID